MMRNLKNRLKKLEKKILPDCPHIFVAHCKEEANRQVKEYYAEAPYAPPPKVIIVPYIKQPPTKGLSDEQNALYEAGRLNLKDLMK